MMATPVVFPDPVELVVGPLEERLAEYGEPARVAAKIPTPRPDRLVTVRHGGAGTVPGTPVVDRAVLLFEAWAPTEHDAAKLAAMTRALVHGMAETVIGGTMVYRVTDVGGPYDLPDPHSDNPRQAFTVQLSLRGATPQPQ